MSAERPARSEPCSILRASRRVKDIVLLVKVIQCLDLAHLFASWPIDAQTLFDPRLFAPSGFEQVDSEYVRGNGSRAIYGFTVQAGCVRSEVEGITRACPESRVRGSASLLRLCQIVDQAEHLRSTARHPDVG